MLRTVARAASLDDRLRGAPLCTASADAVADRLARWRQRTAGGDETEFAAYLAEMSLAPQQAAALMGDVKVPDPGRAPPWAHVLADIGERARGGGDAGDPESVPFGHLWVAAAGAARQEVLAGLDGGRREVITPGALDQLLAGFLADVARLGARAFYDEFSGLRRRLRSAGAAQDAYQRFIEREREGGLPLLVARYPVLGRLVAQRVTELAATTRELLTRLRADRGAIAAAFWPGGGPGRVSSIRFGMGDRHRSGRTVARVEFERGLVLAYKPRPVGAERGLHRLMASLGEAGLAGPLAPLTLERDGYGWAGWIGRRECAVPAELAGYYRRAGVLLALAWLLGSTDLHAENIVAGGCAPAVVDAEMMSPPELAPHLLARPGETSQADAAVEGLLRASVAAAGLLPAWMGTRPDNAHDLSGLTGSYPGGGLVWAQMNTAGMVPVIEPLPLRRSDNGPASGSIAATAAGQLDEVIEGYRTADRWLGNRKDLLPGLVHDSGLFGAPARFVLRPTMFYGYLLMLAGAPDMLRDGLHRSLMLEAVNRRQLWPPPLARLHDSDPGAARRIAAAERRALERQDIPLFSAAPTGTDLLTECGTVAGVFTGAPAAQLRARLDRIGARHQQEQILCLLGTFEGHRPAALTHALPPHALRRPSAGALEQAARQLAALARERAVRAGGAVSWLLVRHDERTGRPGLAPIGMDLYEGRAGLGIFLAAGAVRWGDRELATLARDCLRPIPDLVCADGTDRPGGALNGPASAVYGLALGAELLGDPELARGARRAAAHLAAGVAAAAGPGPEKADRAGDVSGGLLGAALALSAAAGHGAGTPALAAAAGIATLALAGDLTKPSPWDGADRDPGLRAGIAHGLSGATLALHRVAAASGEGRLTEAAGAVSEAAGAALAGINADGGLPGRGWCRGTAGVACAAIALGSRAAAASWTRGAGQAMDQAWRADPLPRASACCGRAGQVELLTLAGESEPARALAATLIPPAGGDWALGHRPGVTPLLTGFHQGLAGLGYTLLRVLSPARFPSVLVWE